MSDNILLSLPMINFTGKFYNKTSGIIKISNDLLPIYMALGKCYHFIRKTI